MPRSNEMCSGRRAVIMLVATTLLPACATRSFTIATLDVADLREQARTQIQTDVRVSTTVLGRSQSRRIFGLDLYDKGVQPVWIEVENTGDRQIRFAPYGTDTDYFPAHEIAYKFRSGYAKGARDSMARAIGDLEMGRYIDSGETRSGFVFTNADEGAKRLNIDLFSNAKMARFTYVLRVPGFVPDHFAIEFKEIYGEDVHIIDDKQALLKAVAEFPCCTQRINVLLPDYPINIVLISHNDSFLYSLLHANWRETSAEQVARFLNLQYFERRQDAILRYVDRRGHGYYELRLWLAPLVFGDQSVWMGQVRHQITGVGGLSGPDPDLDLARTFAMQKFWHSEPSTTTDWLDGEEILPADNLWNDIFATQHFTDGQIGVVWLLDEPVSLFEYVDSLPTPSDP